jgi:UDP-glucose 4-epimerase
MNIQRALITGGAGLIGSHIADLLVQAGTEEVIIFDNFVRGRMENLSWARANGSVTVFREDIGDAEALREAMDGVDIVFHQAAIRITQCAEEPRLAMNVLGMGTFNVLEAAVKARVRKVVAASSASVYGMADTFPTAEFHHPYNNRTLYGAIKTFNEGLLRSFHEMFGLDYVALRYFNVYGPRMDVYGAYTEVLIRWMERIAEGLPCIILGDGKQTMDFVCVEDIARANLLAAQSTATDRVFNVASGEETSLLELCHKLSEAMGRDAQIEHGEARKVNPVPRRLASTEAAKRELGFEARISLTKGLEGLVAWWQQEKRASNYSLAER